MRWGFILMVTLYGILAIKGFVVPRRGTGTGIFWTGIFLMFLNLLLNHLDEKEEGFETIKEKKTFKVYICILFLLLGTSYIFLYIFEVFINIWVFILVVLSFAICEKTIRKFFF